MTEITNYATLQTNIAEFLSRDDLTAKIPTFIQLAEKKINRDFANMAPPLRAMETTATGTTAGNLDLPTGYRAMKSLQIQIGGYWRTLTYKSEAQLESWNRAGEPLHYTIRNDQIVFAPSNDGYDYKLIYFKELDPVSDGVNWTITNAPDLYLYGSLLIASPYIKDRNQVGMWAEWYTSTLNDIRINNKTETYSGNTLAVKSRGAV